MKFNKEFLHGILPAMLMSISVGQIYAFTNFVNDISTYIGCEVKIIQWAFSLGIFFLGMGAAFFGKLVEKNIAASSLLGSILFLLGMMTTQFGVIYKMWPLVLLGYGFLIGLGTGIIYITPVKTLMMWFPKKKALASAIPIIFFGLGSTLATFLYAKFIPLGVTKVFTCFTVFYLFTLAIGAALLKKPEGYESSLATGSADFRYFELMKKPFFISAWFFMLLNISAGLCIIPLAKSLMSSDYIAYSKTAITAFIALAGVFSGAGRLVFAYIADKLDRRTSILYAIALDSSLALVICLLWPNVFGFSMLLINACYGAGFSVIPSILSDRFGMSDISKIHGAVLSAWGIAGLVGNQVALIILNNHSIATLITFIAVVHIINLCTGIWYMNREMRKIEERSSEDATAVE